MRIASRYIRVISRKQIVCPLIVLGCCLLFSPCAHAQDNSRTGLDARIISMPKVERKIEVIQNRSQLVKTRKRVTRVAIADPSVIEIAPFEDDEFAIIGAALGTTTLTLWFEDDNDPLIYEVTTIRDPDIEEQVRIDYGKLERKLAILFPNSKVYLIPLHEKLVVKGQARDGAEAARILQIVRDSYLDQYGGLYGPNYGAGRTAGGGDNDGIDDEDNDLFSSFIVNMLQVPGEFQVMLHVTIAELNRSELRSMGVDLTVIFSNGRHVISSALSGGVPTLSGIFENGDISALINAFASNGTAKILSRPSLTTLSGHPATFLAGGEFAVPTIVGLGGAQAQQTQFRGFGTSMVVTPTVIDGDLIRLRIQPEFSRIDPNNSVNGIPGLSSRRVNTTVELREGQTIVLGGLLSRQQSTEVTRIPILGEIPVVGPILFNSKRANEDDLELLVLVTPELVRAMNPDEVPPVPGFDVTHPNDLELYRYAMTEGPNDLEVYQLAPYGNHVGEPTPVGFNIFNPSPATPQYGPIPHANQPNGYPSPAPWMNQGARYNGDPNGNMMNTMPMQQGMMPQQYGDPMMNQQMMNQQMMNQPMMNQQPSNYSPTYSPQYSPQQINPGNQQGGQGAPLAPVPDPGAQSYRGGSPTAAIPYQTIPNYSQQLFGQPQGVPNNSQYIQAGYRN